MQRWLIDFLSDLSVQCLETSSTYSSFFLLSLSLFSWETFLGFRFHFLWSFQSWTKSTLWKFGHLRNQEKTTLHSWTSGLSLSISTITYYSQISTHLANGARKQALHSCGSSFVQYLWTCLKSLSDVSKDYIQRFKPSYADKLWWPMLRTSKPKYPWRKRRKLKPLLQKS